MKDRLQKSVDAYNIYKIRMDGIGTIYIMIWFQVQIKVYLFMIIKKHYILSKMKGDPNIAFQKISDQTGDAQLDYDQIFNPRQSYKATPWTDGKFDFLVKVYVGTKKGVL